MTPATEAEEAERLADYDRALVYVRDRTLVDGLSGCWQWQKATSPSGYGVMRWGDRVWRAHRFTYHYLKDYLHKSEPVHHRCANRGCVNPEHLQVVSHHDNVAEMLGRQFLLDEIEGLRIELDELTGKLHDTELFIDHLQAELDHYRGDLP